MTEYQPDQLRNIIEAALLVATRPMTVAQLEGVFEHEENPPGREAIAEALAGLQSEYETRGIELVEVASGWRMQTRESMSPWIANLFQEKAPRYSRALLETLVLIAYRQPITRGEIEDIRGVAVSSNIVRTLIERDWVKIVGHRDVPGRPSLLGTTKQFLDYFNLKKIGELPTLSEIKALDEIAPDLAQDVAMLDSTVAPEEADVAEALEAESTASDSSATDSSATDSQEETGLQKQTDLQATDLQEEQVPSDAETQEEDVLVAGTETVDVELAPEPDPVAQAEPQLQEVVEEESETGLQADRQPSTSETTESAAEDNAAEQDDEVVTVAEATIDAMSAVTRPETELLH